MPATTTCNPGPRPAFIPAPNCAKAVMRYLLFGQTIENVWHFQSAGPWPIAQLEGLAIAIDASWVTEMAPLLPSTIELIDITCTALDVSTGPQWTRTVNAVGTNVGSAFPDPGATFAIKFKTDKIGRSYRGRMYWPCLISAAVVAGAISGATATGYAAAIQAMMGIIQTDVGCEHVVLSYQNKCAWRLSAVPTPVVAYTYADLNIDSQRRRLVGRGI